MLDAVKVLLRHLASSELADRLEGRHDVQVLALPFSRPDSAAINIDSRHIDSRQSDHAAGHVLVASTNHDTTVHPLTLDTGFDTVGDHLARDQRVLHTLGTHRHTIGDRRRAKNLRITTRCFGSCDGCVSQLL